MKCQNCGQDNPEEARFCANCGTSLIDEVELTQTIQCNSCGHSNPPDARFCGDCGADLATTVELSEPAVPQHSLELSEIATVPVSHWSRYKWVIVAFVLVGAMVAVLVWQIQSGPTSVLETESLPPTELEANEETQVVPDEKPESTTKTNGGEQRAIEDENKSPTIASVELTPTDIEIVADQTQRFIAEALDSEGNSITDVELDWIVMTNIGTISDSGVLSASTIAGDYHKSVKVVATFQGETVEAFGNVIIKHGPLKNISLNPEELNLATGAIQPFTAKVTDAYDNPIPEANITWRVIGGAGTISNNGIFTAGEQAGMFDSSIEVIAELYGTLVKATASVTVYMYNQLSYSEDLEKYSINWNRPRGIALTSSKPSGWAATEPEYQTSEVLYGSLKFGESTDIPVAVEELTGQNKYIAYIDINQNNDLTDDQSLSTQLGYGFEVTFNISYPDGEHRYKQKVYFWGSARSTSNLGLYYYRACLWEGTVLFEGENRMVAILDDNGNGIYGEDEDTIIIDMDGNRQANGNNLSNEVLSNLTVPFNISGVVYRIVAVSQTGEYIAVLPVRQAILKGIITEQDTGSSIWGATVTLKIANDEYTTNTDSEGQYELEVPVGSYEELIVKAEGHVPIVSYSNELVNLVLSTTSNTMDIELKAVGQLSGTVTLTDGASYHFLAQDMYSYSKGDFYIDLPSTGEAKFWANNLGQRGLRSLGITGDSPLDQVQIPDGDYYQYGVEVVAGNTYVSLAREGEEGYCIIFRITEVIPGSQIVLDYLYRTLQ